MIVVSNSSPLIAMARIRRLELLPRLYGRVTISKEVFGEVVVAGEGYPGASEVKKADWIDVKALSGVVINVKEGLGLGELSAILLAKQLSAELVLLDEWKARRAAQAAGFQ